MQNAAISFKKKNWDISAGGTHNDFDGLGGDTYGRGKTWRPEHLDLALMGGDLSSIATETSRSGTSAQALSAALLWSR